VREVKEGKRKREIWVKERREIGEAKKKLKETE